MNNRKEFKLTGKKMLELMRRCDDTPALLKDLPPCERYSEEDIECYAREEMSEKLVDAFESHCADCLSCAHRLLRQQARLRAGGQKEMPE